MRSMFPFVLLVGAQAHADSSCTARSLGATTMLAIQHTASKAKVALMDEDLPVELHQTHAEQHASLMRAKAHASHRLKAVASLEREMLSDSGSNVSHHAEAASAHNDSLVDYESNETKQLCRACAEAGHSLMSAFQVALAAHATAEAKAVSLNEAQSKHGDSSEKFAAALGSFQDVQRQHQDLSVTFESPRSDFDELCRLANHLATLADDAVQQKGEKTTHEAAETIATEAYEQARAATVLADEKVAAARIAEKEACKGLGLPPLTEEALSCADLQESSDGAYELQDPSGMAYTTKCEFFNRFGKSYAATMIGRVSIEGSSWTYATKDYSGLGSDSGDATPWETQNTFGVLAGDGDFKNAGWWGSSGEELRITYDGAFLMQTNSNCLAGGSFLDKLQGLSWSCGGSVSKSDGCASKCARDTAFSAQIAEQAQSLGQNPPNILFHFGEKNGAQNGNRDRVYITTDGTQSGGADAPQGLGSFMSDGGSVQTSVNVGKNHDQSVTVGGQGYYGIWVVKEQHLQAKSLEADVPKCEVTDWQVVHNGYIYRTLYNAPVEGRTKDTSQEQEYAPMPSGYSIAPDDSDIVSNVIAPHYWDVWRLCTLNKCWAGKHYGGGAGGLKDDNWQAWETSEGNYRIKITNEWYRLLIRTECE